MPAVRFDDGDMRRDAAEGPPPVFAVVDHDPWLRRSLVNRLVAAGFEVETHRSVDALMVSLVGQPSGQRALIVDLREPRQRLEFQSQLRRRGMELSVVIVGSPSDVHHAVSAMQSGEARALQTPLSTRALIDRLREVLCRSARERASSPEQSRTADFLSRREQAVLRQLLAARSTIEIASTLRVSLQTVVLCKRRLLEKFHARNELDLVLRVMGLKAAWR